MESRYLIEEESDTAKEVGRQIMLRSLAIRHQQGQDEIFWGEGSDVILTDRYDP